MQSNLYSGVNESPNVSCGLPAQNYKVGFLKDWPKQIDPVLEQVSVMSLLTYYTKKGLSFV